MTHEAQLSWEKRYGRPAAAAAFASIGFLLAGTAYRLVAVEGRPDNDREYMATVDEEGGDFIVAAALQAISLIVLVAVFVLLYRIVRYRRRETNPVVLVVSVAGPLLLAAGSVLAQIDRVDASEEFFAAGVTSGARGEDRAEDLFQDASVAAQATGGGGMLATAIAFVLLGLNGIRAGIFSRFIGILAVVIGAFYVLPLIPGGNLIIQVFWLGAVGALFLGRWPGGRGPAWESGEAVPWPSAAEIRARAAAPEPKAAESEAAEPPTPRPASRKRKRKRRR